jgi:hypothetical protein
MKEPSTKFVFPLTGGSLVPFTVSEHLAEQVLAYPEQETGSVKVQSLDSRLSFTIQAEKKAISLLKLNYDGSLLVTTSVDVCSSFPMHFPPALYLPSLPANIR